MIVLLHEWTQEQEVIWKKIPVQYEKICSGGYFSLEPVIRTADECAL
jgi:hypothetical protein